MNINITNNHNKHTLWCILVSHWSKVYTALSLVFNPVHRHLLKMFYFTRIPFAVTICKTKLIIMLMYYFPNFRVK